MKPEQLKKGNELKERIDRFEKSLGIHSDSLMNAEVEDVIVEFRYKKKGERIYYENERISLKDPPYLKTDPELKEKLRQVAETAGILTTEVLRNRLNELRKELEEL